MNINEITHAIKVEDMDNFLPLTNIKTTDDINKYKKEGYMIPFTLDTFKKKYPKINENNIFFNNGFIPNAYYYDENKFILISMLVSNDDFLLSKYENQSNEEALEKIISIGEEYFKNKQYRVLLNSNSETLNLQLLSKFINNVNDPSVIEIFRDFYMINDYGSHKINKETVTNVYKHTDKVFKENLYQQLIDSFGNSDTLTIYRGEGDKSTPYHKGYSWTTNINVANFFASWKSNHGKIYTGKIKRKDILDFLDFGESEIIAFSENIYNIEEFDVYSCEKSMAPIANDNSFYNTYRHIIRNLPHDKYPNDKKLEIIRILLLSLILFELEKNILSLKEEDKLFLCTALVYAKSNKSAFSCDKTINAYYKKFISDINLIKDNLSKIKKDSTNIFDNLNISSSKKRLLTNICSIIHDANELDKVHNSFLESDITKLILEESKKLTITSCAISKHTEL